MGWSFLTIYLSVLRLLLKRLSYLRNRLRSLLNRLRSLLNRLRPLQNRFGISRLTGLKKWSLGLLRFILLLVRTSTRIKWFFYRFWLSFSLFLCVNFLFFSLYLLILFGQYFILCNYIFLFLIFLTFNHSFSVFSSFVYYSIFH